MQSDQEQRVIIVTGASRGLGREIALRFGKAGERIVVNFLSRTGEANSVVEDIRNSGGEAVSWPADVREPEHVDDMMRLTLERWGRLDVLINNAGIVKDGIMLRMSEMDWDDVIRSNLTGPFYCIRAASRIMARQKNGHIISLSSISGVQGRAGQASYSSSKAGLIGLTKACAREMGRFNVKINAVLPGYIMTEMGNSVPDGAHERIVRENALRRTSDPGEVADFIYHVSLMNNVSGQVFNLDSRIL